MPDVVTDIPAHVPAHLVRDFDYMHVPGTDEDPHLAWKRITADDPDIFWTPHWGGHWVVTRADGVEEVQKDFAHFSHKMFSLPRGVRTSKFLPLELDPPEHGPYRQLIVPFLSPAKVNLLGQEARTLAIELIETLKPRGRCNFISDFAQQLPIQIFMRMADLPMTDRIMLLEWVEGFARGATPEIQHHSFNRCVEYVSKLIDTRRRSPGDDVFSQLIHARIDGKPLPHAEAVGMVVLLFFGGLETVASSLGFFALFLARSPCHRQQLVQRPELIPNAVEELYRRFGLSQTTRVLTMDYAFKGVFLKQDDVIMVPLAMHGLDERRWGNALEIDFERKGLNQHASFGNGPHKCPGANLARVETRIFLEEWLRRIPDFEITPGEKPRTKSGNMHGVDYLPLSWSATDDHLQ